MLFRKRIARSCRYCSFGTQIESDQVLCSKRGVVSIYHQCRKFEYAPCKRVPAKRKALDFTKYDEEDFSL